MTGPLAGLRVVDFGQYVAGPLAAVLLADQGADVIHVDPPGGPRMAGVRGRVPQPGQAPGDPGPEAAGRPRRARAASRPPPTS